MNSNTNTGLTQMLASLESEYLEQGASEQDLNLILEIKYWLFVFLAEKTN